MSPSGRNRVRGSVLFWVAAALLAGAAGIGFALWRAPKTVSLPAPDSPGAAAPAPMPAPPSLAGAGAGAYAGSAAAPPQQPAAGLPPSGVSADQWRSLQAELAGRPEELRRLTAYFAFNADLQRFRASNASNPGNAEQRSALAAALDAGLDERLRQHELSAPEARLIKIALLDVLVADVAQRQAALAQWEAALPAAPPDAARLARDSEFQRRQAGIAAAWAAVPPAQRDQRALERELDALRRSTFTQAR